MTCDEGCEGDSHQIWRIQATVASLMIVSSVFREAESSIQPQSLGRVCDPVGIAEGPTAIDAAPQRLHFGFCLRLIDKLQPIGGARQRPRREDGERRVFALHTAQTRPAPRFRLLHEVCTQGVRLHVANDLVEVVFCFHRETLVTPLIEMAVPDLVTMLLPPFHMRVGHLLHERGKIAISLGPNDKMPMVGHQTVSAQPHPASSQRFLNDPLERQEVLVLGEKQSTAHASVEHVENHSPTENVASVVTFTAFYQDIPALSIWWLPPFRPHLLGLRSSFRGALLEADHRDVMLPREVVDAPQELLGDDLYLGSSGQAPSPELSGESGESKYPCQCNSLPQLCLSGLDLTRQVAFGAAFPLSVPIDSAWPERLPWTASARANPRSSKSSRMWPRASPSRGGRSCH